MHLSAAKERRTSIFLERQSSWHLQGSSKHFPNHVQDMKEDEKNVKHVLQSLSKELKVHDEAVTAFREVS